MQYYPGDIVEIVSYNCKTAQENTMYGYYENQGYPVPFIGQRFRVTKIRKKSNGIIDLEYWYTNTRGNYMIAFTISPESVMLYHRPFRNWFKYFFRSK